jgi:hypothetical protein
VREGLEGLRKEKRGEFGHLLPMGESGHFYAAATAVFEECTQAVTRTHARTHALTRARTHSRARTHTISRYL